MDSPTDSSTRAADEAAIRDLEAAYDRAWGAGDLSGLVAPFAAGATVVDPFGGVSEGRAEIKRLLGELLAGSGRGSTHTSTITGVTFISDLVALADGEALIEGLKGAGGEVLPAVSHRFTDVLVRGDEGWRIVQVRAYVLMDGPRP